MRSYNQLSVKLSNRDKVPVVEKDIKLCSGELIDNSCPDIVSFNIVIWVVVEECNVIYDKMHFIGLASSDEKEIDKKISSVLMTSQDRPFTLSKGL